MQEDFGTSYNISLSEINGISINDLIDRGPRFSITTKEDNNSLEIVDYEGDEDNTNWEEVEICSVMYEK